MEKDGTENDDLSILGRAEQLELLRWWWWGLSDARRTEVYSKRASS